MRARGALASDERKVVDGHVAVEERRALVHDPQRRDHTPRRAAGVEHRTRHGGLEHLRRRIDRGRERRGQVPSAVGESTQLAAVAVSRHDHDPFEPEGRVGTPTVAGQARGPRRGVAIGVEADSEHGNRGIVQGLEHRADAQPVVGGPQLELDEVGGVRTVLGIRLGASTQLGRGGAGVVVRVVGPDVGAVDVRGGAADQGSDGGLDGHGGSQSAVSE